MTFSIEKMREKDAIIDFKMVVSSNEYEKELQNWFLKKSKIAVIDGFRPGKVPVEIIKVRFADEAANKIRMNLIELALKKIKADHKIRSAGHPKISIEKEDLKHGFECHISYECLPEIALKDFKSIKCEELILEIQEDELEKSMQNLLKHHIVHEKEPKKGKSDWADKVEFLIKVKDTTVTPKKQDIVLQKEPKEDFLKPLHHALHDKEVENQTEVELHYPKNYYDKMLAGKTVNYLLHIKAIYGSLNSKLDDDFAKEFGCDTVSQLREKMRSTLENSHNELVHLYHKRQILDALDKDYDFVVPRSSVEQEYKLIWKQLEEELATAKANGEKDENLDMQSLKKEYEDIATRRVKLGLIIAEIMDTHKIQLTQEEVQKAIIQEALKYPNEVKEVVEFYKKNAHALDRLLTPLMENKAIDFVFQQATKKPVKVTSEALPEKLKGVVPGFDDEGNDKEVVAKKKTTKAKSK